MDLSEPIRRRGSGARRRPEGRERGVAIFVPLGLQDLVEEIAARYRDGEPLDGIFRALVPARAAAQPQAPLDDASAGGASQAPRNDEPEARAPVRIAPQEAPTVSTSPDTPAADASVPARHLPDLTPQTREDRAVPTADGGDAAALVRAAACRELRRARPLWVAGGAVIGVVLTVVAVSLWTPGGRGQGAEVDRLKRQVRVLHDELRQAQEVTLEALDRANGAPPAVAVDPLFRPLR